MAWEGVKWGTVEGLFLAIPETANETRSPMSVNKAWSAACGRGVCSCSEVCFVFHLKPISERKCRKLSWHLSHIDSGGREEDLYMETPINTNEK